MTNNSGITCKSKAAALGVLETLSSVVSSGTQRDAIVAVSNWIQENFPQDFSEETKERIKRIYDEAFDDAARKCLDWHIAGGTPENGAREMVPYLYNADLKQWELESSLPPVWKEPNPNYLPKSDEKFSDNYDG